MVVVSAAIALTCLCTVLGILFGLYAMRKTALMRPVDALQVE